MKYDLTQHARTVLREREIPEDWLERVIEAPELVQPDEEDSELEHRLGRIKEYDNRVLRVIISPGTRPIRVVSAYFDRGMRNKL